MIKSTEKSRSIRAIGIFFSLFFIFSIQHLAINSVKKTKEEKNEINYVQKNPTSTSEATLAGGDKDTGTDILTTDTDRVNNLPPFIIIGASKCGTGAIAHFLDSHSKVCYPGETYFFSKHYTKGSYDYYKPFIEKCKSHNKTITLDKSPNYYLEEDVAIRILRMNPDAKVLLMACNPVHRVLSRYLHIKNLANKSTTNHPANYTGKNSFKERLEIAGETIEEFEQNIDKILDKLSAKFKKITENLQTSNGSYTDSGLRMISVKLESIIVKPLLLTHIIKNAIYYHYYDIWSSLFGKNFLIVNSSALQADPGAVMIKVQQFFGLEPEINQDSFVFDEARGIFVLKGEEDEMPNKGRSIGMSLSLNLEEKLKTFYKPFNRKLASISNVTFDWD